jgi:hypothetical protein
MDFDESLTNAAANRALYDFVDKYGKAASLDLAAYDGKSGVIEQTKRSLKSISESRLGKTLNEAERNIKQQSGFSAETIETLK